MNLTSLIIKKILKVTPILLFSIFISLQAQAPSTTGGKETAAGEQQANLMIDLANSLYKDEKYSEAYREFSEFTEIYPYSPRLAEAYSTMAKICESRQAYDKAARIYLRLYHDLGISSSGMDYYFEYARLQELMGFVSLAEKAYREINQLNAGSQAAEKSRVKLQAMELFNQIPSSVAQDAKVAKRELAEDTKTTAVQNR